MYLFLSSRAIENACSFFSTEKSCRHFPKTIREWEEHAPTCAGRLTFVLRLRKTLLPGYTRIYVTSRKLNSVEREQEKGKKREGDPAYIYKIQGQRYGHKSRKHAVGWLRHSYFMTSIKNRLLVFFFLFFFYFRKLSNQHVIIPENKNPFKRLFWREGNNDVCSC